MKKIKTTVFNVTGLVSGPRECGDEETTGELRSSFKLPCESKKMSHSGAEHGAVSREEALRVARKSLTPGLEGWWKVGGGVPGAERPAVRSFHVMFRTSVGHLF